MYFSDLHPTTETKTNVRERKQKRKRREMYLINDPTYVRKLILSGKKEIKDGKDVVICMELAIEYWVMKNKLFDRMHLSDGGGVSD